MDATRIVENPLVFIAFTIRFRNGCNKIRFALNTKMYGRRVGKAVRVMRASELMMMLVLCPCTGLSTPGRLPKGAGRAQ